MEDLAAFGDDVAKTDNPEKSFFTQGTQGKPSFSSYIQHPPGGSVESCNQLNFFLRLAPLRDQLPHWMLIQPQCGIHIITVPGLVR
jgi:hypothetical protein